MNSLKKTARITGLLYLIIIVGGIFSEAFVRSGLIVSGDPSATANNIMNSEFLFRLGFASELVVFLSDVVVAIFFYVLLRPVSKTLSLVAASFRLAMAAISGINLLNHFAPLLILSGADYFTVFEENQLNALVMLFLKMHAYGYHISLTFFGLHCLVLGYLLFKSDYFPKILGVLIIIASLCYLINSLSSTLVPDFAKGLFPFILLPAFVAELSLCLWLIIKGVREHVSH